MNITKEKVRYAKTIHLGNLVICEDHPAFDAKIAKYEPMVRSFVRNACTNAVCNEEDLYQEGMMAVIIAHKTYDPRFEASLNTWVYKCAEWAILEYQKKHYHFLSGGQYLYSAMKKAGKNATIEDLMELGLSKETSLASTYYNLQPSGYGEALNLADPNSRKMLENNSAFHLDYAKYLNESECFVIEHHFGLNNKDEMTMEEMGKLMGKSRKAISYLINRTLVKLRHVEEIEYYLYD